MKPLIFPHDATEFTTNGWGPLTCISCDVEEERNGIYELTAKIPVDSPRFDKLVEGNIIVAIHSNKKDRQPFQIYSVTKTINGVAEVRAEHISYRLNKNVVMPFEATGVQAALNGLKTYAVDTCPFTFWTDKESTVKYKPKVPKTIKASLFGESGSILDTFSAGDFEFDLWTVKFWEDRGADNGVTIRYGKNLTDIKKDTDISDIYTAIVPYWIGYDENGKEYTVMLSSTPANNVVRSEYADYFPTPRVVAVDFSGSIEEQPTAEQLRAAAVTYLRDNARRQLVTTISASFIELSQTDQYKDLYELEKVNLCDTVTVIHPVLEISDKLRVSKIVYDVLAERNKTITLGDLKKTLANVIGGRGSTIKGANGAPGKSAYQVAVDNGFSGTEAEWIASLGANITFFTASYLPTTEGVTGSIGVLRYGKVIEFSTSTISVVLDSDVVTVNGTHDGALTQYVALGSGHGFFTQSGTNAWGYVYVVLARNNTWAATFFVLGGKSNTRNTVSFLITRILD